MFDVLNLLPADEGWFPDYRSFAYAQEDKTGAQEDKTGAKEGKTGAKEDKGQGANCHSERSEESVVWAKVCRQSGFLAGPECEAPLDLLIPSAGLESEPCPYHSGGTFTLPPAMEWYYKPHHPEYVGATRSTSGKVLAFIYPSWGTTLTLPRQMSGSVEGAVFRVAHRKADATLWWHMDGDYIGETRFQHELRLSPAPGRHTLTVVDTEGNSATVAFEVR